MPLCEGQSLSVDFNHACVEEIEVVWIVGVLKRHLILFLCGDHHSYAVAHDGSAGKRISFPIEEWNESPQRNRLLRYYLNTPP